MDVPTQAELIERIEAFCSRHAMAESRFGRDALGNSGFMTGLRDRGRSPTLDTLNRVATFMAERDAEADSHRPFPGATAGLGPQDMAATAPPSDPPAATRPVSLPTSSSTNDRAGASITCPACSTGPDGDQQADAA